jgi:hypothetical protein
MYIFYIKLIENILKYKKLLILNILSENLLLKQKYEIIDF